ncbi:MAG: restriction endonuclease, SacI family [Verrucomicrobiales bacterium]
MPEQRKAVISVDHQAAAARIAEEWEYVNKAAASEPAVNFVAEASLAEAIRRSVNHRQVTYRFCLPTQLLGKLVNPAIDCLKLQRGERDQTAWDARSLASKVIAPFNARQESPLGASQDPYVGNPMRLPRMSRDDPSKKDRHGWNELVTILEAVQQRQDAAFTQSIFRQVLLEMLRRQHALRFAYPVPLRASLEDTLTMADRFLQEKSGGDRALALAGALFDAIGVHFHLYTAVNRAPINAADQATAQAADLECVDEVGSVVLAVEVKDRTLTLADVEGTLRKAKSRLIKEILFMAPEVDFGSDDAVKDRLARAFSSGQNIYVFDLLVLGRSVLALGGEPIRQTFLKQVGEHLDKWNTQPRHRQAWQMLLSAL